MAMARELIFETEGHDDAAAAGCLLVRCSSFIMRVYARYSWVVVVAWLGGKVGVRRGQRVVRVGCERIFF